MIKIVATFHFKPEALEQAKALATELVTATRQESGCIQYDLLQADKDANCLTILETWESAQALGAHEASAHYTRLVPQLGELSAQPASVATYTQLV